jgi:D-ribose pyranose/furanose isomerase RbsD
MAAYPELVECLRAAAGLLSLDRTAPLYRDLSAVCDYVGQRSFRIAVFGPFNYGKSTLLNALLGDKTLPMDLIPTTGAAITVRYGDRVRTRIQLRSGAMVEEDGTAVLQRFAVLDGDRCMNADVVAVDVFCPHPLLQTGVELVDLPGTNDREAQDALVREQLLSVDLIVQVLDGRKLMTLGEREHLRDWLQDRGIETVVFVVNFLNLLEPEDQKQVYNRMLFVAESFRSRLPTGVSNIYRVDALPALRARLRGDMAAAQVSGLPMFESALQAIIPAQTEDAAIRLTRVQAISQQIEAILQRKIDALTTELAAIAEKHQQKKQIKQQAERLIRNGFAQSFAEFERWLSVTNLLMQYQQDAAQVLQSQTFRGWEAGEFKQTAIAHQQAVSKWVQQAREFFGGERSEQLQVQFPPEPSVMMPQPAESGPASGGSQSKSSVTPTAIATGLGWMLGGPVGGAILGGASYLLNKTLESDSGVPSPPADESSQYFYMDAARTYLVHFSQLNLAALQTYRTVADRIIQYNPEEPVSQPAQYHQVQLLQSTLTRLQALNFCNPSRG